MSIDQSARIAQLEAELAQLKGLNHFQQLVEGLPGASTGIAPALDPNLPSYKISGTATVHKYEVGDRVAFIDSRIEVVPAIVQKVNYDNYDLEAFIPVSKEKIQFDTVAQSFNRVHSKELLSVLRLKARASDPRIIYRKNIVELGMPQRGLEGIVQTHVDVYQPSGEVRVPRFHEFHTSLVGTFFDPSIYIYRIYCYRAPMEVSGQTYPAEERMFPNSAKALDHYTEFHKAYNRYFKEFHLGNSKSGNKWSRVEIQVELKNEV